MSDMKLGLQMWSIHDVCIEKGMPEALCLIREMGYEGFEFALGDCATLEERCGAKPAEVKKALQEYGVKAIGSHISFERLLEDPDPVLKDCVEYEVPYAAIAPIFYGDRTPFEEQRRLYKETVRLSRLFKENGICGHSPFEGLSQNSRIFSLCPGAPQYHLRRKLWLRRG